jgi:hypothetical protein
MSITSYAVKASDGSDYDSVAINAKGSGAGGNGGSVARGGSGASGLLDNVEVSRYDAGVFGSTVIDNDVADKTLDAGTFAYDNQSPVGKRLTTELAGGVSNTVLLSGAAVPSNVRSIHKLETLRTQRITTAIRANKYNRYTGSWDENFPANAVDTLATDNAAAPSRSVPGQLTYKTSAPLAVNDEYKPKNG